MLKQRVTTALLLLPAVYFLIFHLRLDVFAAIIVVLTYLMALEWSKLSYSNSRLRKLEPKTIVRKTAINSIYALLVSGVNLAVWHYGERLSVWPSISWPNYFHWDLPLLFLLVSLVAILVAIIIVLTYTINTKWWQASALKLLLGLVLLPAFFVSFVSIRNVGYAAGNLEYGGSLLLYMLLLIWAADTGAYFTGKQFGKSKLTSVSPNKTWEGVLGGLLLSTIVGWLGITTLNLKIQNYYLFTAMIVLLGIISVFGDLFESALKREANIKDSGNILPGHGGLLDRLDSTITVAPLFYLIFSYFEWFNG